MGGYGSGRRYGYCKPLVEDCMSIDVRQLSRSGCLGPWRRYSFKWQNGCDIEIETKPDAVKLFYNVSSNGQQQENVYLKVPLYWTPCNYGGKRPWFSCPGCGRRVAKLYLESRYFLCRHCSNLAYSSQREDKQMREFSRQMNTQLFFCGKSPCYPTKLVP
jgi:hypothetical protein